VQSFMYAIFINYPEKELKINSQTYHKLFE